jgi:cytochrome c biogenesis protein
MARKEGGIRDFFNSVRLTIVLLAAIALGALLGTIIPQQEAAEAVSSRLHPVLLSVFQAFQLFDVYHSAWFTLLLVLLAAKLIACSLNRFPAAWNFYGVWRSYGGLLRFFMRKYLPLFIDNLTCRLSMYVD